MGIFFLACARDADDGPASKDDGFSADSGGADTSDADTSADTAGDTAEDTAPDGPVATNAVGDCLEPKARAGATPAAVTRLWEGDLPPGDWDEVPAARVIGDEPSWQAFQADNGLTLDAVDFGSSRVVVLTEWRTAACSLVVTDVLAWALPDGVTTYVEGWMRSGGSPPCDEVCEAEASRLLVVRVDSLGASACRRTETWCD